MSCIIKCHINNLYFILHYYPYLSVKKEKMRASFLCEAPQSPFFLIKSTCSLMVFVRVMNTFMIFSRNFFQCFASQFEICHIVLLDHVHLQSLIEAKNFREIFLLYSNSSILKNLTFTSFNNIYLNLVS